LTKNAGNDLLGYDQSVGNSFNLTEANIAGLAILLVQFLPEIAENFPMMTGYTSAIVVHVPQLGLANIKRLGVGFFEDTFPYQIVRSRLENGAFGLQNVPSCASAFLLVVFERFGHCGMDNVTDVGFVNSHAEGYSWAMICCGPAPDEDTI
jgi:hypothetical protein